MRPTVISRWGATLSAAPYLSFWKDSDRIHLHQKLRVCQSCHEHHRNSWRVRAASPYLLGYFESRSKGLSLHDVDIPFDDMFQSSTAGFQRGLQVFEDLFHLGFDVAFSNDCSRGIDCILSANVNCLSWTTYATT